MSWFRVDAALIDHPKTWRLEERVENPLAVGFVIRALAWLSRFCPTGHFGDNDVTVFERACRWTGEAGELVTALLDVGFVDRIESGGFDWHDWDEFQGKVAAKAQKERERKRDYRARKKAEEAAKALEMSRGTTPGRPPLRNGTERNETEQQLPLSSAPAADRAVVVFEHWRKVMKKPARTALDDKRRKAIEKQLDAGYTIDDLKQAIDGCACTPHNMGLNDRNTRYDDIELICRDAGRVDRFREQAQRQRPDARRDDASVLDQVLSAIKGGDPQLPKVLRGFEWVIDHDGSLVGSTSDPFTADYLRRHHHDALDAAGIVIVAPPIPEGAAA